MKATAAALRTAAPQGGRTAGRRVLPSCPPAVLPLLFTLPLIGCELTETVVPGGESVVVLQSVISRNRADQWVLLEYSLTGTVSRGPTGSLAPPESPRLPISGAVVTAEHLGPGPCVGRVDTLTEAPVVTEFAVASGVYRWQVNCAYDVGDRVRVRAVTPAGEVVSGTTRLPGAVQYDVRAGSRQARFALDELRFDRTADTLLVAVTPAYARAMQVEVRRAENQEQIAIYAFTDTLGIAFAGNLVNPFGGDEGETVFRAGRFYLLTVAVTDSNYYDFIRSRSDPLTGRGYLNHIEGGLGVVGAVETQSFLLAVVAPQTDPREGRYHVSGTARGDTVDLVLDVYLDELASGGLGQAFSAFVDGTFFLGAVRRSGDGYFDYLGIPGELQFEFDVPAVDSLRRMTLTARGVRDDVPFPVAFADATGVDTLTMRRLP